MADPATVAATLAAATAAATKAAGFPTTLLLLFFITPPANGPKIESTSFWTHQSTSQIQTQDPDMCTKIALDMINEVKPVKTLTVRAYCLCPAGNGTDLCFNEEDARKFVASDPANRSQPTVLRIGPDTKLRESGGGPARR
jgi:hypothetical protein